MTTFFSNLLYWLLAILLFGILVMLHEFGHFIAARLTGVTVLEFAVGFGPKILSRRGKSGVLYSWRALPFGGYCRFVGEDGEDGAARPDAYTKEIIWKRALISVSGPLMNLLTAVVVLFLIFFAVGLPIGTEPVIDALLPGMPAEAAGFMPGDRILAVNGVAIETTEEASALIEQGAGSEITFGLIRDGEERTLRVTPQWAEEEDPPRYMVGIQYRVSHVPVTIGFVDSIRSAFATTGNMATMIVDVLRTLVTTGEGMNDLAGPIGTVTAVKTQTQSGGLYSYLYLAAIISVNLGLFNLLPIPGLDGSKLLFLLIEKLRGRPLDANKEGVVTLIGFAFLMAVMVLALYQDIARLVQ